MTISEFKAWLEGFEEEMGGNPPTAEQWKSVKVKLAKVSERPTAALRDALPTGWNDRVRLKDETQPIIAYY